jgi:hypothetical protein
MPGRQQIPQEVPEKSAGMLLIELYAILYNFVLNSGAICVRIYFAFMVMVGVCSTCPILVKNNPKFGVPKLIRLKVICN